MKSSFRWWRLQDGIKDEQLHDNPVCEIVGGEADLTTVNNNNDNDNAFN